MEDTAAPEHKRNGSDTSEIVIGDMLRRLIDERPGVKRRSVAEQVGISESALSKYITGRDIPRLGTLIALARHFDVPLDYLILGQAGRAAPPSHDLAIQLDERMSSLIRLERTRNEMLARFSDRMVAHATQVLDAEAGPIWPGVFSAEEMARIEARAKRVDLMVPYLDEDLLDHGEVSELMRSTAANINRSIDYRVLVDVRQHIDWQARVPEYRERLHEFCGCPYDLIDKHFRIRQIPRTMFAGFAVYWLEPQDYPATKLAEMGEPNADGHHLFAILQPGHLDSDAHSVLRPEHANAAVDFFEESWNDPTTIEF